MFRTVPLSIIRSFSLYTRQWYMSYRFGDSLRAGSGRNCSQTVSNTYMTYTIDVCTVKNSWWWTQKLSETCRVLFQKQIWKLVHIVGFIITIGNMDLSKLLLCTVIRNISVNMATPRKNILGRERTRPPPVSINDWKWQLTLFLC